MKSPLLLSATAALLALAACNSKPNSAEVLDSNPDPMANALANRGPVELPPAIKAEKTFRCKDNSLLYVTLFEGDKLALVKTSQTGTATRLTAEKTGDPLVAEGGWKLTGDPKTITVTQPGKPSQSCKS
ncbi:MULTISPECIES: hypothetical protein [Sphingomonas]|jgi:predicted small lipoprotein YifL|uniref:C-type lysozyme inhibitor domain-containing protein n=1 Tax=Sphingomonas taxi TaxID=1549858 RepID=A0A097EG32_9SPHN|nr:MULTISPECIES: hypothetical protein [Sphingomonas]AIT06532.1 hypothetical protein MC45_09305 [Sphingomonas taxi]